MTNYYNEFDLFAAEWLRALIKKGLIPDGEVDTRSIVDVRPDDLRSFTQCHFFAGIGGWSHALRLAGWSDDRPVWTGSCPCQPFSVAGKGKGTADERHLWPEFYRLIRERRPAIVFGEQVASRSGREWFAGVRSDLEDVGYGAAAADLCAAGVGAPHIRQRLYWVARALEDTQRDGAGYFSGEIADEGRQAVDAGAESIRRAYGAGLSGWPDARNQSDMADASSQQKHEEQQGPAGNEGGRCADGVGRCGLDNRQGDMANALERTNIASKSQSGFRPMAESNGAGDAARSSDMADADGAGREGRQLLPECADELSPWSRGVEWRRGADGKERRVKPGVRLLVDGVPNRVGRLRGYGNAIVPQVAAEVIKAFTEI